MRLKTDVQITVTFDNEKEAINHYKNILKDDIYFKIDTYKDFHGYCYVTYHRNELEN